MGVYQIKCLVGEDSRRYIGSSVDIERRWVDHINELRRGDHHNIHLQLAWDEYGEYNFEFSVVELVEDENRLLKAEQEWLDKGGNLFNIARDAKAPMLGKKLSEEAKEKISKANCGENCYMFGRSHSEETKNKISKAMKGENNPMFGKKHNEETRNKLGRFVGGINNPMFGKKHRIESKNKMRNFRIGKFGDSAHPFYGNKHTDESKRIMRNQAKKRCYIDRMIAQGFEREEIYAV